MWQRVEGYYRCVADCWRLFRKFYGPAGTDGYWQELHEAASVLYGRYGCRPFVKSFAKQILWAVLDEIDRAWEKADRK